MSPCIATLCISALVVLVSNSFSGYKKSLFTTSVFSFALAASVAFVISAKDDLQIFYDAAKRLPVSVQFALSMMLITMTYFGSALYVCGIYSSSTLSTPASCDNVVDFDVPDSLPDNDKVFFEECLQRFTNEIIDDLPAVYEMPPEAVDWTHRMVNYTVAGGKMNRGLAVMDVQKILTQANEGRSLSNKVCFNPQRLSTPQLIFRLFC